MGGEVSGRGGWERGGGVWEVSGREGVECGR